MILKQNVRIREEEMWHRLKNNIHVFEQRKFSFDLNMAMRPDLYLVVTFYNLCILYPAYFYLGILFKDLTTGHGILGGSYDYY